MSSFFVYIIVAGIIVIPLAVWKYFRFKKAQYVNQLQIQDLLKYGVRIKVEFEDCVIKSSIFSDENEGKVLPSTIEIADSIFSANAEKVDYKVEDCQIVYDYSNMGRIIRFVSGRVRISRIALRCLLDEKGSTYLYFDPKDESKYYFDLAFISDYLL